MSQLAVELKNVTKCYNEIVAVNKLSLNIRPGEIFGLLGPNGSGKSTTLKMLMGLVTPTSGTVNVLGINVQQNPVDVKRLVGYVPESPSIYEFLTGIEYLDFIGDIYGMSAEDKQQRITEYLKALQLDGREGDMINSYSDGMKKKIALISAFIHKPKLLILDEPLNALDPRSARLVKDVLAGLKAQGVTIIITTHVLEIAQVLSDQIAIMYKGNLLALGNMDELQQKASLPSSGLEDIFLKLTGTEDLKAVVEALVK
ncbi:MAG: ABC transporter ATP-binding protein [Nitrososphaerota archaeon]|jgi:ABC-2 type transport system ATP-binding protein|uniref:ABC transporter ATP-binding protein n=1 Tax=Candidatus Bathycorpusculum sp. TaxID=2994959 RepID=UPI00282C8A62|nr:ABC transporter ATP-binding protein [Candidatus Termiticorpusculum sp.]MCL2256769.1 ABC transporter ATP-binding protein [Candidatus Termiticorpusculum sp.]MCL2293164.1 ABC transporter ATP-binding protein [Candidatus Termiticorpusculum sp.]MDR0461046.1 ABC transporter ATP-binding protein [Nitrososphaerota archaeon]